MIFQILKNYFREGRLHRAYRRWRDRRELRRWEEAGRPQPPPQAFKRLLIRDIGRQYEAHVLVETGTHLGHTISSALGVFDTIYSIELLDEMWERAVRRFANHRNVHLRCGDSAHELPKILSELTEPAVFWLDAHYSGSGTARGDVDSPIMQELAAIARHGVADHILLIDDALDFGGDNGYPTIERCRSVAATYWPDHRFEVRDAVIRITPGDPH